MTAEYKLNLPFQTLDDAEGEARKVLEKAEAQVGFIPNMYAGMVNSPGLLETYLDGYRRFREDSGFTPPEQEVVFLTISRGNGCDYCMSAHSMIAEKKSEVPAEVTEAIRNREAIPDPKLAALSAFTETMRETRGLPSKAEIQAFLDAGYEEPQVLEIILAIAVKTLSNYANHLMHTPLDEVFASHVWEEGGLSDRAVAS